MIILKKEKFKIVGILVETDWENIHIEMSKAWNIFKDRVDEIKSRKNKHYMDISLGIEKGKFRQIICVEVNNFENVPNKMLFKEIPEQRYIYSKHIGQLKNIAKSFGEMYKWAEKNGYSTDEFKIDYGYTDKGLEEEHDLYIRIPNNKRM